LTVPRQGNHNPSTGVRIGEAGNPGPKGGKKAALRHEGQGQAPGKGPAQEGNPGRNASGKQDRKGKPATLSPTDPSSDGQEGAVTLPQDGSAPCTQHPAPTEAPMDTIGDCPEEDIFWDPLEVEALTEEGGDHTRHAESCALARNLQLEEEEARRKELIARHEAQAMQNDEDTDHMAADWVSFFQSEADNKIPDFCEETYQHDWRTSGSGTASRKSNEPEECYCGASCECGRRFEPRARHTRRSSYKASWIRAREELREAQGIENAYLGCLFRHPSIADTDMSTDDEEAWEIYVSKQYKNHEERVKELREEGLRRVGLGGGHPQGSMGHGAVDLTQDPSPASQETQPGLPDKPQEEGPDPPEM
jgi:hypothetical protein